ncbi:MAG: dethiobiotin synthase [Micropepsaceae bacterium]
MSNAFFITATGTDVGKTYVLCRILEQMRGRGQDVFALKPVLSGFDRSTQSNSDAGRLLAALGRSVDSKNVASIAPWRFREPISPDMAAEREGVLVTLADVASFCRNEFSQQPGTGFVEGAGGILSPLGRDFTNLDLAESLDVPVVLVAGAYLGTISHTLTACAALRERRRQPVSIVLCEAQGGPVSLKATAEAISRFVDTPIHTVANRGRVPDRLIDQLVSTA